MKKITNLAPLAFASSLLVCAIPAGLFLAAPVSCLASDAATRPMKLLKLTVSGNKQVPTSVIDQAMTVSVGQKVSRSDLAANFNAIVGVYRKANVGAGFKQKMVIPRPGQVLVEYMIEEQAPSPPQAPGVLRVDKVTFEGNKKVSSDAIASAITLHAGDPVDNNAVAENMKAIVALYKKAGVGTKITPSATYPQPGHAIVDYKIEETPNN